MIERLLARIGKPDLIEKLPDLNARQTLKNVQTKFQRTNWQQELAGLQLGTKVRTVTDSLRITTPYQDHFTTTQNGAKRILSTRRADGIIQQDEYEISIFAPESNPTTLYRLDQPKSLYILEDGRRKIFGQGGEYVSPLPDGTTEQRLDDQLKKERLLRYAFWAAGTIGILFGAGAIINMTALHYPEIIHTTADYFNSSYVAPEWIESGMGVIVGSAAVGVSEKLKQQAKRTQETYEALKNFARRNSAQFAQPYLRHISYK